MIPFGHGAQATFVLSCRHGGCTALHLNQDDLKAISPPHSGTRPSVVLPDRQQVYYTR
jgi:hypothetical protein